MLDVDDEDPADPSTGPRRRRGLAAFLLSGEGWPYVLAPFIPIAVALELVHAGSTLIFATSAIGVIPTAALMGKATEELADRVGPGIGGLLNVTFGNFPELLIAFFALREGLHEVVKASIIGSVLGNVLLVLGASMLVGGVTRERQQFNARAARAQATMLILACAALVMPAVFQLVQTGGLPRPGAELVKFSSSVEGLSLTVAVVLLLSYAGGLWFSLVSHRDLFNPPDDEEDDKSELWSVKRSVILLAIAGLTVGLMSEILVGSIAETAESVGLTEFFIGAVIVAIVGNAAEHWVAVYVAAKDKMDLAVNIAIGSGAQVALFVGPVLVVLSFFVGPQPLPLVFNGFEVAGILLAVIVASHITSQGESTWFEGLMLLAVYAVLVTTFLFAQGGTGWEPWNRPSVLPAISVLGLAALLIGDLAGAKGFGNTDESTLADMSWVSFSLGGILALVTGILAWLLGRSRGRSGDVQAGKIAVGWFVLAVLIVAVVEALD